MEKAAAVATVVTIKEATAVATVAMGGTQRYVPFIPLRRALHRALQYDTLPRFFVYSGELRPAEAHIYW